VNGQQFHAATPALLAQQPPTLAMLLFAPPKFLPMPNKPELATHQHLHHQHSPSTPPPQIATTAGPLSSHIRPTITAATHLLPCCCPAVLCFYQSPQSQSHSRHVKVSLHCLTQVSAAPLSPPPHTHTPNLDSSFPHPAWLPCNHLPKPHPQDVDLPLPCCCPPLLCFCP
jgi:hypothetical protein